jgi:hypothetical protein
MVDLPVLEQEAADHAVARQEMIVLVQWRVRRIGHGAEEGALDLGRNLALDLEVLGLPFDPHRRVQGGELGAVGKSRHVLTPTSCVIPAKAGTHEQLN